MTFAGDSIMIMDGCHGELNQHLIHLKSTVFANFLTSVGKDSNHSRLTPFVGAPIMPPVESKSGDPEIFSQQDPLSQPGKGREMVCRIVRFVFV